MRVFRCFYEAQMRSEQTGACRLFLQEKKPLLQALANQGKLMTFCLYENGPHLYLYYESLGILRGPEELLTGCEPFLLPYPGMERMRVWAERTRCVSFQPPDRRIRLETSEKTGEAPGFSGHAKAGMYFPVYLFSLRASGGTEFSGRQI